jgi:tRNA ligase
MIDRICADRILERGSNHQTLHGVTTTNLHEEVLWRFLSEMESLNDGEDLEDSLAHAIDGNMRVLGLPRRDAERVGAALAKARDYKPVLKDAKQEAKEPATPRYFGLLAEVDLVDLLDRHITR